MLKGWGWDERDRLNVNGSGISLGHPIGATGGRILANLLRELHRRDGRYGLETMCIGGGQGIAAVFERASSDGPRSRDPRAADRHRPPLWSPSAWCLLEAKVAEDDAMPDDLLEEMKGLGLYGLSIPEEYGGLDLSMGRTSAKLVAVELGRTSPAFRSAFGTNVGIGVPGACCMGSAPSAQKQEAQNLPGIRVGR